jgi:hypothetical protein
LGTLRNPLHFTSQKSHCLGNTANNSTTSTLGMRMF